MRCIRIGVVVLLGMTVFAPRALAQSAATACYKVKDLAPRRVFTVTVTNAGVTQTCRARSPARLGCLASQVSGITPAPPAGPASGTSGDLLCYRTKCPKPFPAAAQKADELGGQRIISFKRALMLCMPAGGDANQTTTTTAGPGAPSTTTTTAAPRACEFEDGQCVGTCGNGGRCSVVVSGGACECQRTSCGDADAPSCEGFCEPDEACVFDLTGCRCVSIP